MAERQCTLADNAASAAQVGHGKLFGPAFVTVLNSDQVHRMVKVRVRGNGGAETELKFPWNRQNVWAGCPSTLDCSEAVVPTVGEKGTLYLSRTLVEDNHLAVVIKWPDALPVPPVYYPLEVWPIAIRMECVELASPDRVAKTIDLLDPLLADPGQAFALVDRTLKLSLSQKAWFGFGVQWPELASLKQAVETLKADPPLTSASDKAHAWAQVAAWEAVLRDPERKQLDVNGEAARLLAALV